MPRRKLDVPPFKLHRGSGQARVRWTDPNGDRHSRDLGKFGSHEARENYERFLAEYRMAAGAAELARQRTAGGLIVSELLERYIIWAVGYYRHEDGTPTSEVEEIKASVGPVARLYGRQAAAEFGAKSLEAIQGEMIRLGWCRTLINRRIERVKRGFRWATSKELLPAGVYEALKTVSGLKKGRTAARESEPVGPVSREHIEAVKPHIVPEVWAMIQSQLLSAMRPQDVCGLTLEEIDRAGETWVYRPSKHKTAYRGKKKTVVIGPKAQAVLAPWLEGLAPDEYVFSPSRTMAAYRLRQRAARKSKVPPSQMNRKKAKTNRKLSNRYTTRVYAHAIARACDAAGIPPWGPNRLRHTAATEIRERFGLEAAQAVLGHERADVTQIYAERNLQLARKVMEEAG